MGLATAIPTYKRIPADPARYFEPDEVKKAKDYHRPLTVAKAVSLVLNAGLLLALISAHTMPKLVRNIDNWVVQLVVVLGALLVAFTVIDLPVSIWTEFVHEKKWGFSTNTPGRFVADQIKNLVLGVVLLTPLLLALWWVIRSTQLWWLYGWAVFFAFSMLLAVLLPVVIMPIFNKFTPLEDEELAKDLRGLAEGVGMKVSGVQVMDASKRTKKDNAFFAGMGATRRVVVFDNLLEQPHAAVRGVVAHELGHWRRGHIRRNVALGTVTSLAMFGVLRLVATSQTALDWAGVKSVAEPAAIPLMALTFSVCGAVTSLLSAWVSRAFERQADLDALEITGDANAFSSMMRGLATKNLGDLAPSWWHYVRADHPPAAERLRIAELWTEAQAAAKT